MDQSLVSVMRNINDALQLDKDGRDKEAYVRYVDCIFCISCNLQQSVRDGNGDVVITKQVTKQVKLMQQCVERVAVLVDKIGSTQKPVVQRSPMEEPAARPKTFMIVPPLPFEPTSNTFARKRDITPMEIANKQNQQLMTAFRARMARMNKRDPGAFNLSLTIQRKMAENMAIAKKNEMALAKKMQERQARLEQHAAQRFAAPIGMSVEEQEQRHIYKKILEYEQDCKWLEAWRAKLNANPQEPEIICQLIQETLRCQDHPLTVLLKQYQIKIYEKIYPLVNNKMHRLAVVVVPLDRSLWPPELCNDRMREECKLEIFPGVNGDEDGTIKDDGGSTSHESVSVPPDPVTEELPSDTNTEGSANNPVGSESERDTTGEKDSAMDIKDTEATSVDRDGEGSSHGDECQDIDKHQSDSKQHLTAHSSPSADNVTNDLIHSSCSDTTEEIQPSCTEDCREPNIDGNNENQNQETCTATDAGLESHSAATRATEESKAMDGDNSKTALSDKESGKTSTKGTDGESHSPSDIDCSADSTVQLAESTKKDLATAIEKGKHVQAQLQAEQVKAKRVLRLISEDYDSYNAENMDDLFDDDEEDAEEKSDSSKELKPESPECDLPESDQASSLPATHQQNVNSLISHSSSSGSFQDFPSLSPGDSGQVEFEQLSKEAYQRHVKNISADVHQYLEKLLILFTIAYEQLDSPVGRDQCYASLEETFFKPLWKFLLMLFRLANYKDELTVASKMTQKMDAGPRELGVRKKLCLVPETGAASSKSDAQPYQQAIEQLRCIKDHYTMLSKLECVVKVVRLVCDCVKEFYTSQGFKPTDVPSVGADDLVPVVSYVVMQSRMPQLVSECHAMSEFIHEGYIMGQEGYCLTTLETAVSYIVASDLDSPVSPS